MAKQSKHERESSDSGAWLVLAVLFTIFAIGSFGGAFIEYMAATQLSTFTAGTGLGGFFEGATLMYVLVGLLFAVIVALSIHHYRMDR